MALALGLAAVAAGEARAQSTTFKDTLSSVDIFQPITLSKDYDLRFGVIVRPVSGGGNVTINPGTGFRTADPGIGLVNSTGFYAPGRALYSVTGEGGQQFSIGIPVTATMTRQGGAQTINVNLSSSSASGTLTNSLGAQGTAQFGVGGTMAVNSTTVVGFYSGLYTVTVNYN